MYVRMSGKGLAGGGYRRRDAARERSVYDGEIHSIYVYPVLRYPVLSGVMYVGVCDARAML